jgi:hypothetical protein
MLALQVELCLPRLLASCAEGTLAASGLRPGFWPAGPVGQAYASRRRCADPRRCVSR